MKEFKEYLTEAQEGKYDAKKIRVSENDVDKLKKMIDSIGIKKRYPSREGDEFTFVASKIPPKV